MPLNSADKEKVKRAIPKGSNKVLDAAIARLYIAYPDPKEWVYTGLSGAIVLVDDIVGHTFFLKLVDVNGHRGVLWDQELYVDFQYNQDRSFFHTFEIEDCLVGLLFDDTSDASKFYKKVTTKEKHGSKKTVQNKNAIALKKKLPENERTVGPRGDFYSHGGEQRIRKVTNVLYYDDLPPPEWRSLYTELANAGITEDMIADNKEFIKDYINKQGGPLVGLEPPIPRKYKQQRQQQSQSQHESHESISSTPSIRKKPPPPPPPQASSSPAPSTSNRSASSPSPTPGYSHEPTPEPTPEPSTPSNPSVVHKVPPPLTTSQVHKVPPPFQSPQSAGSGPPPPLPPSNARPTPPLPGGARPTPPLPTGSRPPIAPPRGNVPPPLPPARAAAPAGPVYGQIPGHPVPSAYQQQGRVPPPTPPPRRGAAPPAPPSRNAGRAVPPPPASRVQTQPTAYQQQPPSLPPQQAYQQTPQQQVYQQQPQQAYQQPPVAPPLQQQTYQQPPVAPPLQQRAYQAPPQQQAVPIAPPLPQAQQNVQVAVSNAPPPPPLPSMPQQNASIPPPPPLPTGHSSAAPPPPPPLPTMNANTSSAAPPPPPAFLTQPQQQQQQQSAPAPALPAVGDDRDALLASIRNAGIGALKKVDKSQLDKPSVILQEQRGEPVSIPSSNTGGPASAGGQGSLADALAAALSSRKQRVSKSDDESDGEDW